MDEIPKKHYWFVTRELKSCHCFFLMMLVVLGSLIYSNTLNSPFIFDDVPNIYENPHIRLVELTPRNIFDAARFPEAIEATEKAMELAQSLRQNRLAEDIRGWLQLFKTEQPYIEASETLKQ